jgi:hypothetical protein
MITGHVIYKPGRLQCGRCKTKGTVEEFKKAHKEYWEERERIIPPKED